MTSTQSEHHRHSHQRRRHSHQPPDKLKLPNRPFFSCSFFRHCAQSPLSPTQPPPPPPPPTLHPPPPVPPASLRPPGNHQKGAVESTSESSSSSTSQSFTQWRFPPTFHHPLVSPPQPPHVSDPESLPPLSPPQPETHPQLPPLSLQELFHVAELQFTAGSDGDRLAALQMLERFLVRNPPTVEDGGDAVVPAAVLDGVVESIKQKSGAKSATKVLLALCLGESNRRAAVERGAAGGVVEALAGLEGAAAERALAALELMCTLAEGAAEVRAHALAVPILVTVMGKMEGRGREYAISVLAVVFGGGEEVAVGSEAPPEQVARAVVLAMQQGDCSARGRRKGAQLLKALQENNNNA